jgi:hypothetical protein
VVAVGLLALLTLAQLVQGWRAMRVDAVQLSGLRTAALGSLCSVLLVNGQMYYGTLITAEGGFIKLSDVYYVRGIAQTGPPASNQLVSRRKVDWHGPEWMAIPLDKILFIEKVGAQSQLATLIATDHAQENAKP